MLVIDHGRAAVLEFQFIIAAQGSGDFESALDLLPDLRVHIQVSVAQRAGDAHAFRDDILGKAAIDRANADHRRGERVQPPRDDGIQRQDDVRSQIEGVDGFVGVRAVPAFAVDGAEPRIHAAGRRACADANRADR